MTKIEIIEETVQYYRTNPFGFDPKKYDGAGGCVYYGVDEQMCAVGRCLIQPENFSTAIFSAKGLFDKHTQAILKPEYHGQEDNFWQDLQVFHDDCANGLFELENYKEFTTLEKYYA